MARERRPNLNREMFYDQYMRNLDRFRSPNPHNRMNHLPGVLRESKIFYIDDFVKDSLLNRDYNFILNNPELSKLPFPNMFFEFETGLEYRTLEGKINDDFCINAFLFTSLRRDLSARSGASHLTPEDWNREGFSVYTFGNTRDAFASGPLHEAHFFYEPKLILVNEAQDPLGSKHHSEYHQHLLLLRGEEDERIHQWNDDIPLENIETLEDEYLSAMKMPNLAINILDHIRAENVVITPQTRVIRGNSTHPPRELRPYHLLEIKKRVYPRPEDHQENQWTVNCRFWVMGHNHRYYVDNQPVIKWIQPYIKGPENAPWKNNRYLMLYKNFRDRLNRRGNEDIGTSLEE
ncbi:MAG: hypothetical protein WC438_00020 [Candidatus Pacearchaeota archaeon]